MDNAGLQLLRHKLETYPDLDRLRVHSVVTWKGVFDTSAPRGAFRNIRWNFQIDVCS